MPDQLDLETLRRYAEARKIIDEYRGIRCRHLNVAKRRITRGPDLLHFRGLFRIRGLGRRPREHQRFRPRQTQRPDEPLPALEDFLSASDTQDLLDALETETQQTNANDD